MRVFAYEDITGGGLLNAPLPPGLAHEGEMMARALLADLAELPEVDVFTSRDARLGPLELPSGLPVISLPAEHVDSFARSARLADAVWPIAPESNGRLENLSRQVLELGRILLGSSPAAVRIAASKYLTARALDDAGIACVPTFKASDGIAGAGSWVVKPNDGAGCQETRLFHSRDAASRWAAAHQEIGAEFVLQPFVSGEPCSLSMLCRGSKAWLLSCNRQRVVIRDDQFYFLGSVVNSLHDSRGELAALAQRIAAAIPGLWGYVGVDFVLSEDRGAIVLEINPRLTTSYAGLHASLGCNPAALVLGLLDDSQSLHLPLTTPVKVDVDLQAFDPH